MEQSAAQLPSFTEIAPKSLYLCGKESVTKTDLLVVTGFVHSFSGYSQIVKQSVAALHREEESQLE